MPDPALSPSGRQARGTAAILRRLIGRGLRPITRLASRTWSYPSNPPPLRARTFPRGVEDLDLAVDFTDLGHAGAANNAEFCAELAPVIQREPIDVIDPETRGLLAAIGIHKDKPFAPDERMQQTPVQAADVANATPRAIYFRWRDDEPKMYRDRQWHTYFIGGDYQWLRDNGRDLTALPEPQQCPR